jgi:hypothetical protein
MGGLQKTLSTCNCLGCFAHTNINKLLDLPASQSLSKPELALQSCIIAPAIAMGVTR